jgi:hypothetical protein
MSKESDWTPILGKLRGSIVRGIERIATKDVLEFLGLEQREAKLLAQALRLHGWSGPKSMRFTDATGKSVVASGYERKPGQSVAVVAPVADVSGDLPARLEAVTRLALREVGKVLKAPFDASDGVLTRNKVTAAGIAVNAQLRADEQQLRQKRSGDVMDRLLKIIEEEKKKLIIEEEKKKLPPSSSVEVSPAVQQPEHVEFEPSASCVAVRPQARNTISRS